MGILENESRKKAQKEKIQRAILHSVAVVGVLGLAALAPNALRMLEVFGWKPHRRRQEVIARSRSKLLERGFIVLDQKGFIRLTPKGGLKLRELERRGYAQSRPRRWDGKWRVLIFDIPENRKGLRDKVRATLVSIGFAQLQRSVWIYPHDCEDLVVLLKADFKIGKDLLYLIVDRMENDKKFKNDFGLPLP